MHKISVHAKIIQPGQKPKKLSLSQRFFFVHFPAFRTLFLGEQDNFIHLPADHAEKPLISVDFYRPKCVDRRYLFRRRSASFSSSVGATDGMNTPPVPVTSTRLSITEP